MSRLSPGQRRQDPDRIHAKKEKWGKKLRRLQSGPERLLVAPGAPETPAGAWARLHIEWLV